MPLTSFLFVMDYYTFAYTPKKAQEDDHKNTHTEEECSSC